MKEVIAEKKPIEDGSVALNENCSAISPGRRIPSKQKDPEVITVPCTIKDRTFKKVLIDSGASVSLMPLSIYQRLGIGNVRDTRINLKFARHSIKNAYGVAEDVLVTIEELSFPIDFMIIDIPKDEEPPIILGRPFMRTSRCNFDIDQGTLTLKVYDDEITLNVSEDRKLKSCDVQSLNTGRQKEIHALKEESIQRKVLKHSTQAQSNVETKEKRTESKRVEIDDYHDAFFTPKANLVYDAFGPSTTEMETKLCVLEERIKDI
ncbi:uncharacterized protein LOC127103851 [Lathyrus oleraceus]|uniref:uncharacterized protein LOC127103851 n=1 Tax=Pisum sativum TaxID=3888 RepID=UPI0021D312C5|nr:uncharacterized protein LOC127103851 [Pisum sativum]